MPTRRKIIILLIVACLCVISGIAANNLSIAFFQIAEARAQVLAVKAFNDAVSLVIEQYANDFADLVSIQRDSAGDIAMVQANSIAMNELSMRISMAAQRNIEKMGSQGVGIPLGAMTGSPLMSGLGPIITIQILPIGSVVTTFKTEFEAAGINQTRHKIFLNAFTRMRVIIPSGSGDVEVVSTILVAENIIVGAVPGTYLSDNYAANMLNLAPKR